MSDSTPVFRILVSRKDTAIQGEIAWGPFFRFDKAEEAVVALASNPDVLQARIDRCVEDPNITMRQMREWFKDKQRNEPERSEGHE